MKKEVLIDLIGEELTAREISNRLGISIRAVRYWLSKYNLKANGNRRSWDDNQLIDACKVSNTYSDVFRELGLAQSAGNYETVKKYIKKLNINIDHFNMSGSRIGNTGRMPSIENVMIENSGYARSNLKRRLVNEKILEYKCDICGMCPEWNGAKLVLILDHINGINNDHRKENLRFVCPNCNSQLPTFSGKNTNRTPTKNYCIDCGCEIHRGSMRCKKCFAKSRRNKTKIDWPEISELMAKLKDLNGNYSALGRMLGVSDNAIRKHIKTRTTKQTE